MAADRGAEPLEQLVLGQARDLGEQLVLDATAGDRGHAQDRRRGLRHGRNVGEQDLAERWWEARARASLTARGQQLLGKERVAVRAAVNIRHELGVGLRAEDCAQQRGDLGPAETGKVDPLDAAPAIQFGEPRQQGVAAVELVTAERADEQDRHVPEGPDEVRKRFARCRVGPVQVLDDQQNRRTLGKPLEEAEERLEQPGLHRVRLRRSLIEGAEGRHEARQVAGSGSGHGGGLDRTELDRQVAQGLDERPVREARPTHVAAIAAQHAEPAVAGEALGLARQPRLADAGLAGNEQVDGLAAGGAVQRTLDGVELRIAADDDRAADAGRHDREDTREPGGFDNRHTSRASG